jgi:eukaryotic-like serine/threonine-protein kinase
MTPERYQQIKQLFQAALGIDTGERRAFLDAACAGEPMLRSELEKMLAAHEQADGFIEAPAFQSAVRLLIADDSASVRGRHIGTYRVVREIGQGGMGAVYLAERADEQYQKQVAIKLVRRGLDTEDIIRRFLAERQILANLNHPNIARLLDGGTTEEGLPYFVMDYVEGLPLSEYCDQNKLTTVERLKLFRAVCSAVHYAHQNLVIHRDLKPSNILVASDGTAKLLDFGIAKVFQIESPARVVEATVTRLRAMTPEYASPEQVRGEQITTASDTYSLGVILYQLLTGHRPYRLKTRRADEIARAICDDEPERPSTAISRVEEIFDFDGYQLVMLTPELVSEVRDGQPEKLRRRLRGDLDNIVLMAMRKEAQRRYASVEQFSEDIRRHLEGLPVIARKDTFSYRAGKFVRRNKAGVAAAALIVSMLIAGIIATAWQAKRASEQRDRARLEQTKAERINTFLQQVLSYASPKWYVPEKGLKRDATVLEALNEAAKRIEGELNDEPEIKAEILMTVGDTYRAIGYPELAVHPFESAINIRRDIFGESHYKFGESVYYLGGVKNLTGDAETGERLYRQALEIFRAGSSEGPEARQIPYVLLDLGTLFGQRGDYAGAESLYREALDLFFDRHGGDHILVAMAHEYLGVVYYDWGDFDKSEAECREAVRTYRKTPGSNYALSLSRLGLIQKERGNYQDAEPLLAEALDLYQRAYGEAHYMTRGAKQPLAHLTCLKGDCAKAKADAERDLALLRQSQPEGHMSFAGPLSTLGTILTKMGHYGRAEGCFLDAIRILSRAQLKNPRSLAATKGALGECLMAQKRFAEAETLFKESYELLKACQVAHSPRLKETLLRLATLYEKWNRPELAAQFRKQLTAQSQ